MKTIFTRFISAALSVSLMANPAFCASFPVTSFAPADALFMRQAITPYQTSFTQPSFGPDAFGLDRLLSYPAKFKVFESAAEIGHVHAADVVRLIEMHNAAKVQTVLMNLTGSTPLTTTFYEELVAMLNARRIDLSLVHWFGLDEYYVGADYSHDWRTHPQSYVDFMFRNLYNALEIPTGNIHFLNGQAANPSDEAMRYDQDITEATRGHGIDWMTGGVGTKGHFAFNERITTIDESIFQKPQEEQQSEFGRLNEFLIATVPGDALAASVRVIQARLHFRSNANFVPLLEKALQKADPARPMKPGLPVLVEKLRRQPITLYAESANAEPYRRLSAFVKHFQALPVSVELRAAGDIPNKGTHLVQLALSTVIDNSRFFGDLGEIPVQALTIGPKIMRESKRITVLATGINKGPPLEELFTSGISYDNPVSQVRWTQLHRIWVDRDAAPRSVVAPDPTPLFLKAPPLAPAPLPLPPVIWVGEQGQTLPAYEAEPGILALRSDADARALLPDVSDLRRAFLFEIIVNKHIPGKHVEIHVRAHSRLHAETKFDVFSISIRQDQPGIMLLEHGFVPTTWEMILSGERATRTDRIVDWFDRILVAWGRDHGMQEIIVLKGSAWVAERGYRPVNSPLYPKAMVLRLGPSITPAMANSRGGQIIVTAGIMVSLTGLGLSQFGLSHVLPARFFEWLISQYFWFILAHEIPHWYALAKSYARHGWRLPRFASIWPLVFLRVPEHLMDRMTGDEQRAFYENPSAVTLGVGAAGAILGMFLIPWTPIISIVGLGLVIGGLFDRYVRHWGTDAHRWSGRQAGASLQDGPVIPRAEPERSMASAVVHEMYGSLDMEHRDRILEALSHLNTRASLQGLEITRKKMETPVIHSVADHAHFGNPREGYDVLTYFSPMTKRSRYFILGSHHHMANYVVPALRERGFTGERVSHMILIHQDDHQDFSESDNPPSGDFRQPGHPDFEGDWIDGYPFEKMIWVHDSSDIRGFHGPGRRTASVSIFDSEMLPTAGNNFGSLDMDVAGPHLEHAKEFLPHMLNLLRKSPINMAFSSPGYTDDRKAERILNHVSQQLGDLYFLEDMFQIAPLQAMDVLEARFQSDSVLAVSMKDFVKERLGWLQTVPPGAAPAADIERLRNRLMDVSRRLDQHSSEGLVSHLLSEIGSKAFPVITMAAEKSLDLTWGGKGYDTYEPTPVKGQVITPAMMAQVLSVDVRELNRELWLRFAARAPIDRERIFQRLWFIGDALDLPAVENREISGEESQELKRTIERFKEKLTPFSRQANQKRANVLTKEHLAVQFALAGKLIRERRIAAALLVLMGMYRGLQRKGHSQGKAGAELETRDWFGKPMRQNPPETSRIRVDADGKIWILHSKQTAAVAVNGENRPVSVPRWHSFPDLDTAIKSRHAIIDYELDHFAETLAYIAQLNEIAETLNALRPGELASSESKRALAEVILWIDSAKAESRQNAKVDLSQALAELNRNTPQSAANARRLIVTGTEVLEKWRLNEIKGMVEAVSRQVPRLQQLGDERAKQNESLERMVLNRPKPFIDQIIWWIRLEDELKRVAYHGALRAPVLSADDYQSARYLMHLAVETNPVLLAYTQFNHIRVVWNRLTLTMGDLAVYSKQSKKTIYQTLFRFLYRIMHGADLLALAKDMRDTAKLWKTGRDFRWAGALNTASDALLKTNLIVRGNLPLQHAAALVLIKALERSLNNPGLYEARRGIQPAVFGHILLHVLNAHDQLDAMNFVALDRSLRAIYGNGAWPDDVFADLRARVPRVQVAALYARAIDQNVEVVIGQLQRILAAAEHARTAHHLHSAA